MNGVGWLNKHMGHIKHTRRLKCTCWIWLDLKCVVKPTIMGQGTKIEGKNRVSAPQKQKKINDLLKQMVKVRWANMTFYIWSFIY